MRLVGYELKPTAWQSNQSGEVILYWQPLRRPDFGLAKAIQVLLRLSSPNQDEPLLTVTQPMLPPTATNRAWARGSVIAAPYPVSLPPVVELGQYTLDLCLAIAGQNQILPGTVSGTNKPVECLTLSVNVTG
ncbi:MAG: hypothetical protein U0401_22830 [Anaerolineae bacterium]